MNALRVRVMFQVLEPAGVVPTRTVVSRGAVVIAFAGDDPESMRCVLHAAKREDLIKIGASFIRWAIDTTGVDGLAQMLDGANDIIEERRLGVQDFPPKAPAPE